MGGSKQYEPGVGIKEQTFEQIGTTKNGIKILHEIGESNSSVPRHSNTPFTMYATQDSNTGKLKQITFYGGPDGRTITKQLDWGHPHGGIKQGDIHVHFYKDGIKVKDKYRKANKRERKLVRKAMYGK